MTPSTPPRRRWFQFSLGTVFVLVAAVCLLAGGVAYLREGLSKMPPFVEFPVSTPPEVVQHHRDLKDEALALQVRGKMLIGCSAILFGIVAGVSLRSHLLNSRAKR